MNFLESPVNSEVVRVKVKYFLAKYVVYFLGVFILLSLLDYSRVGKRTIKMLHDSAFSSKVYVPTQAVGFSQHTTDRVATKEVFNKLRKKDCEIQAVMEKQNKILHLTADEDGDEEGELRSKTMKKMFSSSLIKSNRSIQKDTAYSPGFYLYLDQRRTYMGCEPLVYPDGKLRVCNHVAVSSEPGVLEDLMVYLCNSHSVLSCIYACDGAPVDRLAYRLIYITQNCIAFFMTAISGCVFNYMSMPIQANILFDITVTTPATIVISKLIKALYTCPVGFSVDYQLKYPLIVGIVQCLGKLILVPLVIAILFLLLLAALFSTGHNYVMILVYFFLQVQLYGFFLEIIFSCLMFTSRFYMRCTVDLTWRSIVLLEVGRRYSEFIYHNSLEDGKDYHYRCYYVLCVLRMECIYQYTDAVKKGYLSEEGPTDVEMTQNNVYDVSDGSRQEDGMEQVYQDQDFSRNSSFFTYDSFSRPSIVDTKPLENRPDSARISNPLHQIKHEKTNVFASRINNMKPCVEEAEVSEEDDSALNSQCVTVATGSEEQRNETDEEFTLRKKEFKPDTRTTFVEVFRKFEVSEQLASTSTTSNNRVNFMHNALKKNDNNILGSKR